MLLNTLQKPNPVMFCSFAFPSDCLVELNIVVLFCGNNSSVGKCLCVLAHSVHTDSTINVDVNFGVNFGS